MGERDRDMDKERGRERGSKQSAHDTQHTHIRPPARARIHTHTRPPLARRDTARDRRSSSSSTQEGATLTGAAIVGSTQEGAMLTALLYML